MNLKVRKREIDPEQPFENDLLSRKSEVLNLTALLRNVNSPAVLAIDSRWGTGKTTFINMWEKHLKLEDVHCLNFNAWETDFSEDPLVAFLGEMNEGLEVLTGSDASVTETWERVKSIGRKIVRRGIPAIVKIATAGIIDASEVIEEEIANAAKEMANDALDSYLKQRNAISSFRDALSEVIQSSSNGNPVVIFVDELDRCRPTYAISLLERIKHLFNIEGLVFVIALDKGQLAHSIKAVYGDGLDSIGYLRRFIDFEYQLKEPDVEIYIRSVYSALDMEKYFEPRKKYSELQYDKQDLLATFVMLAKYHALSLREVEQLLAHINLAVRTATEKEFIHPMLLAFLVVAKNKEVDIYQKYVSGLGGTKELIEYLYRVIPENVRNNESRCPLLEGMILLAASSHDAADKTELTEAHRERINSESLSVDLRDYSSRVIQTLEGNNRIGYRIDLAALRERIEFTSQFIFPETK